MSNLLTTFAKWKVTIPSPAPHSRLLCKGGYCTRGGGATAPRLPHS